MFPNSLEEFGSLFGKAALVIILVTCAKEQTPG